MAKKNRNDSIDLNSRSRRPRKKKRNVKLIIINILATITLVISALSLTGMFLLDYKPLHDPANEDDQEQFGSTIESSHEDVSYFLVMGLDESESLTDVIMVICFDHQKNEASIMQIPRDTFVGVEISTGKTGKINAVYGSARSGESKTNALIRCVNQYLGLPIDHYITFTLKGFRGVVDAVGGVEITLERKITVGNSVSDYHYTLGPGTVLLDGEDAESFVRHRNSYSMGDLGRVKAQRDFMIQFAKKVMSMGAGEMISVAKTCFGEVKTDLSIGEALSYVKDVRNLSFDNIYFYAVPGQAGTYKPKGLSIARSYYSIHKDDYLTMLNEHFLPYSEKLTKNDLKIQELHKQYEEYEPYEGGAISDIITED